VSREHSPWRDMTPQEWDAAAAGAAAARTDPTGTAPVPEAHTHDQPCWLNTANCPEPEQAAVHPRRCRRCGERIESPAHWFLHRAEHEAER
jgi:hypothetical protein